MGLHESVRACVMCSKHHVRQTSRKTISVHSFFWRVCEWEGVDLIDPRRRGVFTWSSRGYDNMCKSSTVNVRLQAESNLYKADGYWGQITSAYSKFMILVRHFRMLSVLNLDRETDFLRCSMHDQPVSIHRYKHL